jgi:DEAD/DEAH box helicase domain-containing protein
VLRPETLPRFASGKKCGAWKKMVSLKINHPAPVFMPQTINFPKKHPPAGTVSEYLEALLKSDEFGPQVAAHRTLPPSPGRNRTPDRLPPEIRQLLNKCGIERLYSHQEEAVLEILAGRSIVVATPTASGKSLVYNIPLFTGLLTDPHCKALYLFPLKALARDQLKTISAMAEHLPPEALPTGLPVAAVYDGDTTSYKRKKIRDNLPPVLITNPDMLHLSMLPYQENWGHLFADLRYIVLDEVHTYRGVFGSHMAWLIRRLRRACSLYNSDPVFILSSATIGNPGQLARELIDREVTVITRSGAPRPARHVVLLNPLQTAPVAAAKLLQAAVHRKLRTIVYTQSRKMTELITMWTERRLQKNHSCIASYRAGFLPEDRREIESRLADGSLLGVISTSALELGIDIGNLDICLLVGYPGSMMATWQRAGRVGRGNRESLVVLIGHEDALDQHFMRNPDDFFDRDVEPVVLNPANSIIVKDHLVCMAAEAPLAVDDPGFPVQQWKKLLDELTTEGRLLQSASGTTWFSARKFPQQHVNLRGGGIRYSIFQQPGRTLLGDIDGFRAFKECHQGAVYLHRATSYHVDTLDLDGHEILVTPLAPPYYTRANTTKETKILDIFDSKTYGCTRVHFGRLRVTETVTGYRKILHGSGKVIGNVPLDLPPRIFETQGLWIEIPEWIRNRSERNLDHFMGGIHAMEHAMIGVIPLLVLCDRNDIGGISYPHNEQTLGAAVFIYDGYSGGMGLTARGFARFDLLLDRTRDIVAGCSCESGCPSCVHSPKCGSGNRPIDKASCLHILRNIMDTRKGGSALEKSSGQMNVLLHNPQQRHEQIRLPENYGVFDIETQLSAAEVGGWHRADKMRVSVAVLYLAAEDRYLAFEEDRVHELLEYLFRLDLVVGFNNKRFDNKVLSMYSRLPLSRLPSFDILEEITHQLGYRLSLDRLAEHTLGVKKSSNGLQALKWFKQGKMREITEYCTQDVRITRDLFIHGIEKKYLLFQNKAGHTVRLPVDFNRTISAILARP